MKLRWLLVLAVVLLVALSGTAQAKPGDIIVGDSNDASVWRIKPKSGNKQLISDDKRFDNPNDSVFGPDGKIYVADYGAFADNGAVFSINPKTRKTRVVSKDPLFRQPDGIAMAPNGDLFVSEIETDDAVLLRVELPSGDTSVVSEDPLLAGGPVGVVVPPKGDPIVAESNVPVVASIDPVTGDATTIADGGDGLFGGEGLTRAPDGTLYMASSSQGIAAIDPQTGEVETVVNDPVPTDGYGLALDFKGRVLMQAGSSVAAVTLSTDAIETYDATFDYPEGLEVEPPICGGKTATIVGTTKKDEIKGSRFADVIATLGGNDVVKGGAGKDVICTGDGRDKINGGTGKDKCKGEAGRDRERKC